MTAATPGQAEGPGESPAPFRVSLLPSRPMDFEAEDVREIFERLGQLEMVERVPPRNFVYVVERRNRETVTGQVVERADDGLTLTGNAADGPVPWEDVASIKVSVE